MRMLPVRPPGVLGPVGFVLPTFPQGETPAHMGSTVGNTHPPTTGANVLAELCRRAEGEGAGALWSCDHLFWPTPILEPLMTLALAAGATERVPLGTCVLQLPLRSPAVVAKEAATLQALSGGRFVLGVGVGGHPQEFAAARAAFDRRGRDTDEAIQLIRAAWASGESRAEQAGSGAGTAHRERGDTPVSPYRQLPVPEPVPIWIGGSSPAAARRAAREGDGWIPVFTPSSDYGVLHGQVMAECERRNRDPSEVVPAAVAVLAVGEGHRARTRSLEWLSSLYGLPARAFERHLITGPPAACAEAVSAYHGAGARHVAVMVAHDDALSQFAALADALGLTGTRAPAAPRRHSSSLTTFPAPASQMTQAVPQRQPAVMGFPAGTADLTEVHP